MFESAEPPDHSKPALLSQFMPYPDKVEGSCDPVQPPTMEGLRQAVEDCCSLADQLYPKSGTYSSTVYAVKQTVQDILESVNDETLSMHWIKVQHERIQLEEIKHILDRSSVDHDAGNAVSIPSAAPAPTGVVRKSKHTASRSSGTHDASSIGRTMQPPSKRPRHHKVY
jgi:hypothetical protein